MADGDAAGQPFDDVAGAEVVAYQSECLVGVEMLAVVADDAACFLAAMLQSVQTKRRGCRGVGVAKDTKNATFVVEMIVEGAAACTAVRRRDG